MCLDCSPNRRFTYVWRMPPTVLLCLFLPDVAQKRGIWDLNVPSALLSLQSFVPVWRLGSVPRAPQMLSSSLFSLSVTHQARWQEKCGSAPSHPPSTPSLSPSYCVGGDNTPILPWPNPHALSVFPLLIFSFCFLVWSNVPSLLHCSPPAPLSLSLPLPLRRNEGRIVLCCDIENCIH